MALSSPFKFSPFFLGQTLHRPFRIHMVKSLGFLFNVFAKYLYMILSLIKLQRILNLSISTCTISTESRESMAVDSFCVGSFRNGTTKKFSLFLQTLKRLFQNHFKVNIYGKGNFELVLSTMEPHKEILFRHVYPHHFIVYAIFIVFVSGCLTVESLEAVQAEVLLVSITTIAAPE